jgi:hypothetical protein
LTASKASLLDEFSISTPPIVITAASDAKAQALPIKAMVVTSVLIIFFIFPAFYLS